MTKKKHKHHIQLLEISDIEPNQSGAHDIIDLIEDDSQIDNKQNKNGSVEMVLTDSGKDGSKKTDSKSSGNDKNEIIRKPKQNNFIEMVEMQKKHEKHHKSKGTGKHGNHKLIPAQVAQDIAKGQPNTRVINPSFNESSRKSQQYAMVGRNTGSFGNDIECQIALRH